MSLCWSNFSSSSHIHVSIGAQFYVPLRSNRVRSAWLYVDWLYRFMQSWRWLYLNASLMDGFSFMKLPCNIWGSFSFYFILFCSPEDDFKECVHCFVQWGSPTLIFGQFTLFWIFCYTATIHAFSFLTPDCLYGLVTKFLYLFFIRG